MVIAKKILKQLCLLSLGAMSLATQANLLITPTKITLLDADRTQEIILLNDGNERRSYRVEWSEKRVDESGDVKVLTAAEATNFPKASGFIRFSPRQVTLNPGERQIVKLIVRRPQNLKDGDYRSYLSFIALPVNKPVETNGATGIQLNLLMSYSLPVLVRKGASNVQVTIDNTDLKYDAKTGRGLINVNLSRSGSSSAVGNLIAYWTPTNGEEQIIGRINDMSIYTEVNRRIASPGWLAESFTPSSGKLRVVYEGVKEYRGTVLAEKTISLSAAQLSQ